MSSMNLYVGNLSFSVTEASLKELFAPYGEVVSARIITDRYSGQPRGFAFVEMSNRAEGEKAMAALNGQEVDQRRISVNEARPREEKRGRGYGGGKGRGRY
ncbi:MAG: RNA-binding protein [Thermodesulfobacteriota bacterium]